MKSIIVYIGYIGYIVGYIEQIFILHVSNIRGITNSVPCSEFISILLFMLTLYCKMQLNILGTINVLV